MRNIFRPKELPAITGLSKTTIWRLERAGKFPSRVKLTHHSVGYHRAEVEAWLDSRKRVVEG